MAAAPASAGDKKLAGNEKDDLFFDEAFYHAYQGQYFEAIQRLDTELAQYHRLDEPGLDTLHYNINEAEFSVGDFELDYRMHYKAGRAIKRVLSGSPVFTSRRTSSTMHCRLWEGSRAPCPQR
jgi:hypothetical protein